MFNRTTTSRREGSLFTQHTFYNFIVSFPSTLSINNNVVLEYKQAIWNLQLHMLPLFQMKQLQGRRQTDNRAKTSCRHKEDGSPEEMEGGYK
jgi:hypothetical protein